MERVVMVSYARTPIGRYLGGLKTVPVQDLATLVVKEAIKRAGIDPQIVNEVVLGHVISSADTSNLGRLVAIQSGLPFTATGYTVNRICASGIQSIICAANAIRLGQSEVVVAGGAEALSRVPFYLPLNARYEGLKGGNQKLLCSNDEYARHTTPGGELALSSMGETCENIVSMLDISREDQDLFAYESQMKAKEAMNNGRFDREIIPVEVKEKKNTFIVSKDEHPRPDTTLEGLAKLKPCFKEGGSVTAGNSSGQNDAAAAVVLMSESKAKALGLKPMAYIGESFIAGVDPRVMGLGPVGAIQGLLSKTGRTFDDIDVLEINEAFAGQVLGCLKQMGFDMKSDLYKKLNPHGGAVALGHPLGMSGTRLAGSVAMDLVETGKKFGIASACIGGGMGLALAIEAAE